MLIEGLYTVQSLDQNEQEVNAQVKLHADHDVFKGHFPGNPIMPGVCMIQMIKEITEKVTEKALFLSVATNVKFMAKINPEENEVIDLSLKISQDDDIIKVKNITSYGHTVALKLSTTFKIID
jgi:3-hydroxyacyl-[acyl-carrier-protein] dehydratase